MTANIHQLPKKIDKCKKINCSCVSLVNLSVHSHYDLSAEGVVSKHREHMRKEAEKYARAAMKEPSAGLEMAEQIRILTETYKKFVSTYNNKKSPYL